MYILKVLEDDEWVSWSGYASPRVINMYLDLLRIVRPEWTVAVFPA